MCASVRCKVCPSSDEALVEHRGRGVYRGRAAILRDADVLVNKRKTFIMDAQLAGVPCYEAGLFEEIPAIVTCHLFTAPHMHVRGGKSRRSSSTMPTSGGRAYCVERQPTQIEITKRFFR